MQLNEIAEVKRVFNRICPVDFRLNPEHMEFSVDGTNSNIVTYDDGNRAMDFYLNPHSFNQFVKLFDNRLGGDILEDLPDSTKEQVVNDLLARNKKKSSATTRTEILVRNKKPVDNSTFDNIAMLSTAYKPVDNSFLLQFIERTLANRKIKIPITIEANYDYVVLKVPHSKIKSTSKEIYSGITFTNGQTGKVKCIIRGMIWELVCTNGLMISTTKGTFLNHRHVGDIQKNIISGFAEWGKQFLQYSDVYLQRLMDAKLHNFHSYILNDVPKNYALVSKKLAKEMYAYVAKHDKKLLSSDTTSMWELMRAFTYVSQGMESYKRHEFDTFANEFAIKELGWSHGN